MDDDQIMETAMRLQQSFVDDDIQIGKEQGREQARSKFSNKW